jgi:hypothetical protein
MHLIECSHASNNAVLYHSHGSVPMLNCRLNQLSTKAAASTEAAADR